MSNKSDGRLRTLDKQYIATPQDAVVPSHLIEKYDLRPGMVIEVELGKPVGGDPKKRKGHQPSPSKKKQKYNAIAPDACRAKEIVSVEGQDPSTFVGMRQFLELTSIDPAPRLTLEYDGCEPTCRLIDLFCPVGYGTRGMIVSPPKAGKTTVLKNIAEGVHRNHPDAELFAVLIDERPEEVTDFSRNAPATVWASSNDHTADQHCAMSMLAIERARRLVEMGKDVVVLMDSLTRLGRAFNTAPGMASTGRTLSGGIGSDALAIPKQIFGSARRLEEGGSLTIIATALVDTGSRGDQVIFEEFKGTGNMELILDRKVSEMRLFPAMNIAASGTRKEEKMLSDQEIETIVALRRRLQQMTPTMQVEQLLVAMKRFKTNAEMVAPRKPAGAGSR